MLKTVLDLQQYQGTSPDIFFENNYKVINSPFLESFKISTTNKAMLVVREISSQNLHGASDQLSISLAQYENAKSTLRDYPLALQYMEIDQGSNILEIFSGQYNPAPIYYHQDKQKLIMSWDPNDFLQNLDLEDLDLNYCKDYLRNGPSYNQKTLFKSLKKLPAGCTLKINNKQIEMLYPDEVSPYVGRHIDNIDVIECFEDILKQTLKRWPIKAIETACEYSGGLDSTVTSCLLSEIIENEQLHTYGIHINNEGRKQQVERREEAIALFNFNDLLVDIEEHLPFSNLINNSANAKYMWPISELYFEAMHPSLDNAKAQGIHAFMTGIGGDELTFLFDHEKKHLGIPENQKQNIIPSFVEHVSSDNKHWPDQRVSESTRMAIESRALVFLKHGLWHINPFAMPEIIEFTRQLPVKWRQDRRIFKAFLNKKGLSEEYLYPSLKENFSQAYPESFERYKDFLLERANNMLLAELNIIDGEEFVNCLNQYYRDKKTSILFPMIKTFNLEFFLRHITN